MTLIELRKLADDYADKVARGKSGTQAARAALQSAIQALQAENEFLKQDRNEWRESTVMANANAASEEKRRRNMQEQRDTLAAKLAAVEADAERLDWIQQKLFTQKWNGVVGSGCATQWSIAPDYRHTVAKMKTGNIEIDFRAAIDAAKGGQHEDA